VVSALPGGTRAAFLVLVAVVALQRLAELALSRAHVRRMKARGGREAAAAHYPFMVALHAAFLVAAPLEVLLLERRFRPALALAAIGVLLAAEALRVWTLSTLGDRWSTRVIVIPGEPAVTAGPFRFLRHPNYLVVALEIAALPLVHSAWLTAIVFSALNAALMAVRIPAEERALAEASRA
jgi:methyltransferase